MEDKSNKVYGPIGSGRLLTIEVILDDGPIIYSGEIDEAPENIRQLKYSHIEMTRPMKYYVYSKWN